MADTERTKAELQTIFADGQPPGSIDPQDMRDLVVTSDVADTRISTGLISGGEVTVNLGDSSKFDIAAGTGVLVDNFTDPLSSTREKVSWSVFTAQTIPNIATQPVTVIGLDLSGGTASIVFNGTVQFTGAQSRVIVSLGILIHQDNVVIDGIFPRYSGVFDIQKNVEELARFIKIINVSGNTYGPNGADLQIDKSAGETFNLGINYANDRQSPNSLDDPEILGLTFSYVHRDGVGGFTFVPAQTLIDPEQFDDGSGTPVSVQANRFTIQRLWFFTVTNETIIHYGQTEYTTLTGAVMAINTEVFDFAPQLTDGFRCWLVVKKGVTDLTAAIAAGDAQFIQAGRFGDVLRSR